MTDNDGASGRKLSRRRMLALASTGLTATVAGCGADGADDTTTTAETTTSTTAGTTTTDTTEQTTEEETTERTTEEEPADATVPEGGAHFGIEDGFASVGGWVEDAAVDTVTEPTYEALDAAVNNPEPNIVVFETSGTIDVDEGRLSIENDKCWVAGQTAPSPGITLVRGDLRVNANDCVIQHLRVRPGDAGNDSGWEPDTIRTADEATNNIIDHCSASWSVDENISPGYDAVDTTISNCIISEALSGASHHKGEHSMGTLVGDRSVNNALIGNVFAHNKRRNPRLKDGSETVVANNLMYNFDSGTAMGSHGTAVIEGNGYLSPHDEHNIKGGQQGDDVPDAYLDDNYTDGNNQMTNGQLNRLDSRPLWPDNLSLISAADVEQHNTTYAGARPADRTEHDQRVLDHIRNGNGTYIDSQDEVGGYPELAVNTHELDVPDSDREDWLAAWAVAVEEEDVEPPGA